MPFKSEEQRRYMHANLPEIAQRWEQEYSNGGIASQGGMKNYLGEQPMVNAPKFWQSAPDHEMTELAYITPQERDVLVNMNMYGTMNGSPNEGPSGIMSLNGWGSKDRAGNEVGMSGAATSAAESGGGSGADRKELAAYHKGPALPPGVLSKDAQDYRNQFIAAGGGQRVNPGFFDSRNTVSPTELAMAKAYNPTAFKKARGRGIMDFIGGGGFLGNIVRGVGQKFGLGNRYNQPTYDMSKFNNYGADGVKPGTYDFDPDAKINTGLTEAERKGYARFGNIGTPDLNNLESLINSYTRGSIDFNPAMTVGYGTGIENVDPNVTDSYTSANYLPAEFQDMAKFAKVTKQDLARYTPRNQKDLIDVQDWESALGTGTINKDMTKYEFEQMKKGNITQPGVYPKGYFEA
jgi:hypothetical protein